MTVNIQKRKILTGVPSASGIEKIGDKFWIMSDNSPWIFSYDNKLDIEKILQIESTEGLQNSVIPKKRKNDYEAMTIVQKDGKEVILMLGSGTKWPKRNKAIVIDPNTRKILIKYDLTGFYEEIMDQCKLEREELNIEAAAILKDRLYLFNRGKNKLIVIKTGNLFKFLEGTKKDIKIKDYTIDLPEINGIRAGFSGATGDPENNRLVFTASVEVTSDWVDDGEILGSYIGIIPLEHVHHHFVPKTWLLRENDEDLLLKVESLVMVKQTKESQKYVLVSDSDGESSELIEVEVRY